MDRRKAVLGLLEARAQPVRVPAAFFIHFDTAFHRGQAAVDKHLEYFEHTGMDVVKVQYEDRFPLRPEIERPADWTKMPCYGLDYYHNQLEILEGIITAVRGEALVIQTMYSPFMQACTSVGRDRLKAHVVEDPQAVNAGMAVITESMLAFVKECVALGVDGFYASTQGGDAAMFGGSARFAECVEPYDRVLMEEMERACAFNILHVCDFHGGYLGLEPFVDYPGHVVSAPLKIGADDAVLADVAAMFGRPVMGGLDRHGVIVSGTEAEILRAVDEVVASAPPRFFLGADCTLPGDVSWDNIRTAIAAAHAAR
jgi:uroporphyrinogen decarboxylase